MGSPAGEGIGGRDAVKGGLQLMHENTSVPATGASMVDRPPPQSIRPRAEFARLGVRLRRNEAVSGGPLRCARPLQPSVGMRIAISVLLALHGAIHLLGFVKAF